MAGVSASGSRAPAPAIKNGRAVALPHNQSSIHYRDSPLGARMY